MFVLVYAGCVGFRSGPKFQICVNPITIGFIKIKPIQPNDTIQTTKF